MKTTHKIIGLLALSVSLSACVSNNNNPDMVRNAGLGAAAGGLLGQAIGRNTEATAAGAVIGGIIGSQVNTGGNQYQNNGYYNNGYPNNQQSYPVNNQYNNGYHNNGYHNNGYYNYGY